MQRGRPVRSRSAAAVPKVSAPASRSKDDSDKENTGLSPEASTHRGRLAGGGPHQATESRPKDPSHACEHPLAERTQVVPSENPCAERS